MHMEVYESILDEPKESLDPAVWQEQSNGSKPMLTPEALKKLSLAVSWVQEKYRFNNLSVFIIGSICSNSWSENSDIDIDFCATGATKDDNDEDAVKEFGWAFKKDFIENYIEKFPADSKIGTHPFEVYFNPNPFQCFMSVGCYNFLEKKWEVGPQTKGIGFDPISEYYADAMKQVDKILKDIRAKIFELYELAFVVKKSKDQSFQKEQIKQIYKKLEEVSNLFKTMKNVRSNFQKPAKSKEEALKRREDRKQHVVDAAFKFLEKFGYIQIMKDVIQLYDENKSGVKMSQSYIVDRILTSIKDNMSLKHLQDSEDAEFISMLEDDCLERLDEGLLKTTALAALIAIPSILPSSAIASVMKRLPKSEVRMTNPNFQEALASINTKRLGAYSMTNAINIISWTLYGEAGSQEKVGKEAVASVILNMAGGDPTKFVDIIFTPSKFSMWNPDDKFAKLNNLKKAIDKDYQYKVPSNTVRIASEKKSWDDAVEIATRMALGNFKSTIGKRNAYLNIELTKKTNPKSDALGPNGWSTKMTDKLKIKDHTFGYLPENDGYALNKIPKGDPNATTYKVQRGDSLWKIARMFNTTSKNLALLNGITRKTPLRIGQILKLKAAGIMPSTLSNDTSVKQTYVTVKSGDTLAQIAKNNKTTVQKILELNRQIKDPNKISIGQKIQVA